MTSAPSSSTKKLAWFIGLWLISVGLLGVVALVIRYVLNG
ncbi:MAG: DUF2474 domain-containing protein [Alphaproteobacteria bacterium]|jgi:hypothetical protein|nr:DUF2474 domain-containing protein [Alphaproteobacteria bacterium]MAS48145.1 DUF2474 domain-containing protein [Alphaproteobacteria bacterium]MAX96835.1 DUF2474 domain-containing protein [Alphaproteobacteria bacterium]MBN53124.1 DUF2474 domain-containing protein [Alphaproteobacteria bacterium]OUT39963.1 MAG: hypothetical protein CBB62_11635 [Micavibrio sp. TMED2]